MNEYFNWSEKNPYGILVASLMIQGNIVIPGSILLILYTGASEFLIGPTVIISFCLLVMNISLQPPRLVAKIFAANIGYHLVLVLGLILRIL